MHRLAVEGVQELSPTEQQATLGGTPVKIGIFFVSCFVAGFKYGTEVVGPALFGDSASSC
jgi:hypothetical protein